MYLLSDSTRTAIFKRLIWLGVAHFLLRLYVDYKQTRFRVSVNSHEISYPAQNENIRNYLKVQSEKNQLPIYTFYPVGSTGQLNNQIIAFVNALCISRAMNATLVVAPVHHGEESNKDWTERNSFFFNLLQIGEGFANKFVMTNYFLPKRKESLLGDYFDSDMIKQVQPILTVNEFMASRSGSFMKKFRKLLVRKGEARDYYETLERNYLVTGQIEETELDSEQQTILSRKDLDCKFDVELLFKGVPFRAGINQNFVFLPRIFRSHLLNCTKYESHWLYARKFLQPNPQLRQIFEERRSKWGKYLAIHLRFKPSDENTMNPNSFVEMFARNYNHVVEGVDHIYLAYSPSSKSSVIIANMFKSFYGSKKILTAGEFLDSKHSGTTLNFKYSMALLDMWSCVKSNFFLGRQASSLSINVVYWRDALNDNNSFIAEVGHKLYTSKDFISES